MSEAFSAQNQLYLDGSTCIQDLHSPQAFVSTILQEIDSAKDQVILSALYLGTGSLESQIVERAEKALLDTANRPNFKISFFLDHSRGQRGNINSVTLLTELVAKYHPRAQVYLYQMPQLRGFMDYLPLQLKELLGVYHCKFSVFDDKAILTGANLSYDYFTDRQDRYFLIAPHSAGDKAQSKDCALFNAHLGTPDANNRPLRAEEGTHNTLAQYLTKFAAVVSKESHQLQPDGTLKAPLSARGGATTMRADLLALVSESIGSIATSKKPSTSTNTSQTDAANTTNSFILTPAPTRIHPLIQHAPLHIHQESEALLALFTQPFVSLHNALLCMATPYTNFRSVFLQSVLSTLHNKCSVELCVPSVPAHGFGSAKGLKGFVPALHYYSLQVEAERYVSMYGSVDGVDSSNGGGNSGSSGSSGSTGISSVRGSSSGIGSGSGRDSSSSSGAYNTFYYMRPQWTYHTKGIWLFPESMTSSLLHSNASASHSTGTSANASASSSTTNPTSTTTNDNTTIANNMVTYIGSSNFGERSWSRDFELGFVVATSESPLQQLFLKEYLNMRQHCGAEYSPPKGCGVNASMYHSVRNSFITNRIGSPVVNTVPVEQLPRHNSVQKWLLYTVARVIRSFL